MAAGIRVNADARSLIKHSMGGADSQVAPRYDLRRRSDAEFAPKSGRGADIHDGDRRGELVADPVIELVEQQMRVLENYLPTMEGLSLFYPGYRQIPAALRGFIDMIRALKSAPSGRPLKNPPSKV